MPNNFRKTGNYYASKAGSDANNGSSPETPKATVSALLALASGGSGFNLVLGAGMYEETFNALTTSPVNADGVVKLKGTASNMITRAQWYGVIFENYNSIAPPNTSGISFTDCIFINCASVQGVSYTRCLFINCPNISQNAVSSAFDGCNFINCTNVYIKNSCVNSYFNGFSDMRITASTPASVNYNNVMGAVYIGATKYANLAAQLAADSTYNTNSINAAPKFNNANKNDYTLAFDSPHLGNGLNGVNIGVYPFAVPSYLSSSPEWQTASGAVFSNLEVSGQDAVISAGQTSGTVTSSAKRLFPNPTEMEVLYYYGQLMFNKSATGGGSMNNNVPDANVFAGANANGGGNPDRLTIEARWSTNDEMPAQDSDWTNGGFGAAGLYYKFEINAEPRMYYNATDGLYYGCGSASYVLSSSFSFPVVWIQYRVTLTNAYLN